MNFILRKTAPIVKLYQKWGLRKKGKPRIAFCIGRTGMDQFVMPVVSALLKMKPNAQIIIMYYPGAFDIDTFKTRYQEIFDKLLLFSRYDVIYGYKYGMDLFVTPQKFDNGLPFVYSICLGYGVPAKGMFLTLETYPNFDAYILPSPVADEFIADFLNEYPALKKHKVDFLRLGYPKTDHLFNNDINKKAILESLGLDPEKKSILYAPAFNEFASLRENGLEIIRHLGTLSQYNIIIKLPYNCFVPGNKEQLGGIDWRNKIKQAIAMSPNISIYDDYDNSNALLCADILLTCVASISWEFFMLMKPVIFLKSDIFYRKFEHIVLRNAEQKTYCNSGREFGIEIDSIYEVEKTIAHILDNYDAFPLNKSKLQTQYMLYNKGCSADYIANFLLKLSQQRPRENKAGLRMLYHSYKKALQIRWSSCKS